MNSGYPLPQPEPLDIPFNKSLIFLLEDFCSSNLIELTKTSDLKWSLTKPSVSLSFAIVDSFQKSVEHSLSFKRDLRQNKKGVEPKAPTSSEGYHTLAHDKHKRPTHNVRERLPHSRMH
ncbi:MAG: hypothetical protein HUK21_10110 [Fibrobacteraceae bacterium]|nr:hypothetical protein [Fibrobacteraceae bacterium]